jgi:hypothetical protein
MGHVYMIVFWFHRICICTQHQNGVDRGNEKDILLKILLKMGSIFFKYYCTLNVQLWCYGSVCASSICFLSIATCQGMCLQHHTCLHVGSFNGLGSSRFEDANALQHPQ